MKYANTYTKNGVEIVLTVLPLHLVPGFDPNNPPQANTYCVPDEVEVGWIKSDGIFIEPPINLLGIKKKQRADAVAQLKVTTQAGHTYDADLDSQTKMGVYLAALNADDIIPWVMSDNSIAMIDRVELREALRLAGTAMANLWIQPYV